MLKTALLDFSPIYERDMNEEIKEITKVLKFNNSIKTFTGQKEIELQLIS